MTDTQKWLFVCMKDGPSLTDDSGDTMHETSCTLHRGHSEFHSWWNDDGTVNLKWSEDYVWGDGRWREGVNDD